MLSRATVMDWNEVCSDPTLKNLPYKIELNQFGQVVSNRLSDVARRQFSSRQNEVYLSAVSTWEICLKYSPGKLPLP